MTTHGRDGSHWLKARRWPRNRRYCARSACGRVRNLLPGLGGADLALAEVGLQDPGEGRARRLVDVQEVQALVGPEAPRTRPDRCTSRARTTRRRRRRLVRGERGGTAGGVEDDPGRGGRYPPGRGRPYPGPPLGRGGTRRAVQSPSTYDHTDRRHPTPERGRAVMYPTHGDRSTVRDRVGLVRAQLAAYGPELLALSALAVAQPLLDLFGRNPEFFVASDSTRPEIVAFALVVAFAVPALALATEVAGPAHRRAEGREAPPRLLVRPAGASSSAWPWRPISARTAWGWRSPSVSWSPAGSSSCAGASRGCACCSAYLGFAPLFFLGLFLFTSATGDLFWAGEAGAEADVELGERGPGRHGHVRRAAAGQPPAGGRHDQRDPVPELRPPGRRRDLVPQRHQRVGQHGAVRAVRPRRGLPRGGRHPDLERLPARTSSPSSARTTRWTSTRRSPTLCPSSICAAEEEAGVRAASSATSASRWSTPASCTATWCSRRTGVRTSRRSTSPGRASSRPRRRARTSRRSRWIRARSTPRELADEDRDRVLRPHAHPEPRRLRRVQG